MKFSVQDFFTKCDQVRNGEKQKTMAKKRQDETEKDEQGDN